MCKGSLSRFQDCMLFRQIFSWWLHFYSYHLVLVVFPLAIYGFSLYHYLYHLGMNISMISANYTLFSINNLSLQEIPSSISLSLLSLLLPSLFPSFKSCNTCLLCVSLAQPNFPLTTWPTHTVLSGRTLTCEGNSSSPGICHPHQFTWKSAHCINLQLPKISHVL